MVQVENNIIKSNLKFKWGGNFNCLYCSEYSQSNWGFHKCNLYKTKLSIGKVPGKWVLPCSSCHKNKTYGGKYNE